MGTKFKQYDKEFKEQAIKLALSSSQSILKTANELGVTSRLLALVIVSIKNQRVVPAKVFD